MKFLENLSDLLYANKMSRSDLARAINIAPSTVNSWFNRSCENISLKTLVDIANYFHTTLDELVNGKTQTKATGLTTKDIEQLKRLLTYYEEIESRCSNGK